MLINSRKKYLEELQEQENIITGKIIEGILITDIDLKNKVINIIGDFLKKYGYLEDNVISKLSNIKLVTTNVNLVSGKLFYAVGNTIYI